MSVSFGTSEDASSLSDASGISLNSRLGSCHFDRASNDKFSVEFLIIVIFFNYSQVLKLGALSRYYKDALTEKSNFL